MIAKSRRGAPRYFKGSTAIGKPRILAIFHCVIMGVWKKKSWDLEALMVVPEASEKRLSKDWKAMAS